MPRHEVKILTSKDIINIGPAAQTYTGFNVEKSIRGSRGLLRRFKVLYSEVFFLSEEATLFRRDMLNARYYLENSLDDLADLQEKKDKMAKIKGQSLEWIDSMNEILKDISKCEAKIKEYRTALTPQREIERRLNAT